MATIPIQSPHPARTNKSRVVPEAATQTSSALTGYSFVKRDANGYYAAAAATPGAGPADTGLAFAIEPGHNYAAVDGDRNLIEVLRPGEIIEINLKGTGITAAQLATGAAYGLSIDGTTGFFVLDVTKTSFPVMEVVGRPRRGIFANGVGVKTSGTVGDDNVRVLARLLDTTGDQSFGE